MTLERLYSESGAPHDRYVVVGTSGSGKTTLAGNLAGHLGCPHVELDALFWLPDWEIRPEREFRGLVEDACAEDRWVVDGNYSIARDIAWSRADAVIWLDLPFSVVMAQIIKRTLGRCLTGRALWNGNRESIRRALFSRESMIWYAAKTWKQRRDSYATLLYEPRWRHLDVFRVYSTSLDDMDVRRGTDSAAKAKASR